MHAARKESHNIHSSPAQTKEHRWKHYHHLAAMIGAHFVVMYALMYLMVNKFENVFINVNNFYMSGAMAAPMAILMLLFMKSMYANARLNAAVYAISGILLVAFIWFTRQQALVGNEQFIRSMIPHHSGAILMCGRASITDAELKALCGRIIANQQEEIEEMKAISARLQR